MKINRTTVLIIVVAFTAAFTAAMMRGYGSHPRNTSGTIGAARQYRADQLTGNDVELTEPQMQAFMQSDLFHRMQLNPEFRKAVQSGLPGAIQGGDLGRLAKEGDALGRVVSDPGFVGLSSRTEFNHLLAEEPFQRFAGTLESNRQLTGVEIGRRAETAVAAHEISLRANDLAQAAQTAKLPEIAHSATALWKSAESLRQEAESVHSSPVQPGQPTELDARTIELSRQAESVAHAPGVTKDPQVAARAEALSRSIDALAQVTPATCTAVMSLRTNDLLQRSNEVAKAAEAAKWSDAAKASELSKSAAELARVQTPAGMSVESAARAEAVARQATELAKSLESAKAMDLSARARELSLSAEALSRAVDVARSVEAARSVEVGRASELSRMAETGSLARDPEFARAVEASGLSRSTQFTEMMKAQDFQRLIVSRDFQSLAKMSEFGRAMTDASMLALVRTPEFGRILFDGEVRKFLAMPEAAAAAKQPEFARAFLEPGD